MKNFPTLLICLIFVYNAEAQKMPSFGKIDIADLQMTDCPFDKGAEAVKLIDYGKMYFDRGTAGVTLFKTVYEYRIRIKILKDKGISYANVEIPFYDNNNEEQISAVDACTFNLDESGKVKVTNVSKSSIYTKRGNKRFSRLIIAFPEVKVGSVIEYKYKLSRETFTNIKDWYFQSEIPTRYSEYETVVPVPFRFKSQKFVVSPLDEKTSESIDVVTVGEGSYSFETKKTVYSMHDIVGIRKVPFMGSPKDYEQRLEFQLSAIKIDQDNTRYINTSWADIVKGMMADSDFGAQLTKDIPGVNELLQNARMIGDDNARINYVFNAVRSRMLCTDNEAIFASDGVATAWEKKTGNMADINLALINLLNKVAVKASPILLSTRDNGLVNKMYYSDRQFNNVMAYVNTGSGFLVLDATDKHSDYRLTPPDVVNTSGFVVEGDAGRWVDLVDEKHKYAILIALEGTIDDKGMMKGECSINSMDYCRKKRVDAYSANPDNFKQTYFIKPYPTVVIEDISVKNTEADSLPFMQKIVFSMPVNNSGGYSYFNTNMFNDFETNPFVEDERSADIDFGFTQEYTIYCNFTIPDGYVFDALPENISMALPDKTVQFTRMMSATNNVLNGKIDIAFKSTYYPAGGYPEFHEFYKKLLNSLNEQIVIKKK